MRTACQEGDLCTVGDPSWVRGRDLQQRFALEAPRLLVCGLNPHAGEAGHMGTEELELMAPVLRELRNDLDPRVVEEEVELADPGRALPRGDDDGGLESVHAAHEAGARVGDRGGERIALRLFEEDRENRRGIDDHQAKTPRWS